MVASSKQPSVLREIFEALGNDPYLVAECLVRPILAERTARSFYARDERFHGEVRRVAEAVGSAVGTPEDLKRAGGEYFEQTRGNDSAPPSARLGPGRVLVMDEASWQATRRRLAARFKAPGPVASDGESLPVGRVSRLREEDDAFSLLAVLSDSGDSVTTATAVWRKTPFETWWQSARAEFGHDVEEPAGPYRSDLPRTAAPTGPGPPCATRSPIRASTTPRSGPAPR